MSYAFDARFSPTELDLAEILHRLEPCLYDSGITFDGEIIRLHSRDGVPTALSMATQSAATFDDVVREAKSWWGVSLYCVSRPLAEVLGRTDSIEVYLRIFQTSKAKRMLVYNENAGAFRARVDTEELARDLVALVGRISAALELELAIYAEEDGEATAPAITELERRLGEQAKSQRALAWLAVVAGDSMGLSKARELAGPWGSEVRLSTSNYVVLPFLSGEKTAER